MRVLVCGGRHYYNRTRVNDALDRARPSEVIAGGATGADMLAIEWAQAHKVDHRVYYAHWKLGNGAGPIRNRYMLTEARPDLVIAFTGGRGTADMVTAAEEAGVRVIRV